MLWKEEIMMIRIQIRIEIHTKILRLSTKICKSRDIWNKYKPKIRIVILNINKIVQKVEIP
jgi:hypothetical protein